MAEIIGCDDLSQKDSLAQSCRPEIPAVYRTQFSLHHFEQTKCDAHQGGSPRRAILGPGKNPVLRLHQFNISRTAQALKISRPALQEKMKIYRLR